MKNHLLNAFVSPIYSVYLKDIGLKIDTPYFWQVNNGLAELHTHVFDMDEVYKQAFANQQAVANAFGVTTSIIAAFTVADMEKLLPDYFLSCNTGTYTLTCDKMWALQDETSNHLPDVFAMMVLQCIRKKIVSIEKAAEKIMNL